MKKRMKEKIVKEIAFKVAEIKKPVADCYIEVHKELSFLGESEDIKYMPTPFEIADFYGITYKFVTLEGDMPSYLSRGLGEIYISNRYPKDSFKARILCAHELGHFFMHGNEGAAMNDDILNEYLPEEMAKEYEANVFAILLMPQIMGGEDWGGFSFRKLNRRVFEKL